MFKNEVIQEYIFQKEVAQILPKSNFIKEDYLIPATNVMSVSIFCIWL